MAPLAVRFWGDPSAELALAGITGTNGKTTTAFLLREILEAGGTPDGAAGHGQARSSAGAEEEVERTTPEAVDLQRTLRRMLDAGDRACAMEVSSHALAYGRADGLRFDVKVFTNLTQDHLDFHSDMEDYFAAKRRLFVRRRGRRLVAGVAVVNLDDEYGKRLVDELGSAGDELLTFSASGATDADFRAEDVEFDAAGSRFTAWPRTARSRRDAASGRLQRRQRARRDRRRVGARRRPAARSAAALATPAGCRGASSPSTRARTSRVLVDYAHTPDSLDERPARGPPRDAGRLICVFGCGGDRDRDKRPLMGEDRRRALRSRDRHLGQPALRGPRGDHRRDPRRARATAVEVELDRRAAIALALERAAGGDTVVIAGKGHEQGQEFEGGRKLPFDDREVARQELRRLLAAA